MRVAGDQIEIKNSKRTYSVRQAYTSMDTHRLLAAVMQAHDPYAMCRDAGVEFALSISPIEHKTAWLKDTSLCKEFAQGDTDNELVAFLRNESHMREYHALIEWFDCAVYYRHKSHALMPWSVCKDLLFRSKHLVENAWYFCETFEVNAFASRTDLSVSCAAFVHASYILAPVTRGRPIESCTALDLDHTHAVCTDLRRRRRLKVNDFFDLSTMTRVFDRMLEYVRHMTNTYIITVLDDLPRSASTFDLVLRCNNVKTQPGKVKHIQMHFVTWAKDTFSDFFQNHPRVCPSRFAVALLKVLLMRKVMNHSTLTTIKALGFNKRIEPKEKRQRIEL